MKPAIQPCRILLAIGVYEASRGGASEWLEQYARWLVARGHRVGILCAQVEAPAPPGCDLLALPPTETWANSWQRAKALQRLLKSPCPDIVHDTGCLLAADVFHPLMGSLIHNWQRQLRAWPMTLRPRRIGRARPWHDLRMAWHQSRHHRLLVACSRVVAADFARLGCPSATIIHNGIRRPAAASPEAIRRLREELQVGNRLLVLATATNFYLKGVLTLLHALPLLTPAERSRLVVVFTGRHDEPAYQYWVERHHLQAVCRPVGWVDNIEDYYNAADIFVHPTYHDAGSLSTLKGLAAGSAVVTTRFDGSAELISPGINGLVMRRPDRPAELAAVLRRLLEDGFRNALRNAARRLGPELDQTLQFQKLAALYPGVVAAKTQLP